jgi:predicted transcriptional regulator
MQQLTKAEEQIMLILWDLKKAMVKEVIAQYPEPKPAYNTVSTFIRILEKKGVVGHEAIGKNHIYFPLIAKDEYKKYSLSEFKQKFFGGSPLNLMSFFAEEEGLDEQELKAFLKNLQNKK